MNALLGLIVLGVVIFIHEMGHFLAAKLVGAPAPVFSIGFGPAILKAQWGGTEYRLSALPLGGYVLFGQPDDLNSTGSLSRIFIFLAGPLANFATALAIYQDIPYFMDQLTGLLDVVAKLFTLQIGLNALAGPVGLVNIAGDQAAAGLTTMLNFVALLSLNLGVLNLLPLPILDGGQILIAAAEGVTRRRIDLRVRVAMALVCWVLFFLLIATVSFYDIGRLAAA